MSRPPRGPRELQCRADSSALLSDLDVLSTSAWQTLPSQTNSEKERELVASALSAEHGAAAYAVALQALWHNCPDALEAALGRLRPEVELLEQKLEFTRIRQEFVFVCTAFHTSPCAQALSTCAATLQERCIKLAASQPVDHCVSLPGLVCRRDTLLLRDRIHNITEQLVRRFKRCFSARPPRRRSCSRESCTRDTPELRTRATSASRPLHVPCCPSEPSQDTSWCDAASQRCGGAAATEEASRRGANAQNCIVAPPLDTSSQFGAFSTATDVFSPCDAVSQDRSGAASANELLHGGEDLRARGIQNTTLHQV
mmetsp:Transcript_21180/g.59263  ORF Transcript_21180/g.59263 Transcript_21180/m.59263 type:complete len:313 (-) Transcript_21180:66-1004(-)